MGKLFGTDGIRGAANEYPITAEMAVKIGRAAAFFVKKENNGAKIIIGKDTRISGDMIEHALSSGICSAGVDVYFAGVLPTPGIAFLTSDTGADAGVVISASHNPYYDNGIKFFNSKGYKLSDEAEDEIEKLIFDDENILKRTGNRIGRVRQINDAGQKYADFLKSTMSTTLKGMKIVVDCSNGAACKVAPLVFSGLEADAEYIFVEPDGMNINKNCGSQHPEVLSKKVIDKKADIGLAFDGDADRLTAVDEKGNVLTCDQVLAVCARHLKEKGKLKNNIVVSTVMSNMGLGVALKAMGIDHIKTKVGDRYVVEEMISEKSVLGGEDSGHMIFLDYHTTGDGILSALRLIKAVKEESKPLSELAKVMDIFPQALINIDVKEKPPIDRIKDIKTVIESVESNLGEKGRVLVRYSGTQPVCRIMVEGPTRDMTRTCCQKIADVVKEKIGI